MANRKEILQKLDEWLEPERFKDYCPNGLQVEGRETVETLVTGVTASLELIEAAIAADADMLLVHHGYFWKGEDPCIRGMKKRRLELLLERGVNLVAYHLPLDEHPEYGNNRQLADVLCIEGAAPLEGLVWSGDLPQVMTQEQLAACLAEKLGREPLHVGKGKAHIRRVGWCTGAAQGFIDAAADAGLDAYISGEISEPTTHIAREREIHYYAAGHHATERYGVQALGAALAREFGLQHRFIDCNNPV